MTAVPMFRSRDHDRSRSHRMFQYRLRRKTVLVLGVLVLGSMGAGPPGGVILDLPSSAARFHPPNNHTSTTRSSMNSVDSPETRVAESESGHEDDKLLEEHDSLIIASGGLRKLATCGWWIAYARGVLCIRSTHQHFIIML